MPKFDSRQLGALDWVGVVAGAIALIVSFFSWRHVTGLFADVARSIGLKTWYTAWGSNFTGWFPILLLVGAAVLLLAGALGVRVRGVPVLWLVMALAAVVLIVIRWATLPEPDAALLARVNMRAEDVESGASIGLYLGLVASVISLVGALFRVRIDRAPVVVTQAGSG